MIPVATKAIEVDHLPGEEIAFTIGNPQWVMKSLTKLYSNPILATIREYSTNARDAHVESGKSDLPIKVTLPTLYHPYFEVEDFGVGMSEDELKSTYTQYGTSTKRGSNSVNGMLGFGSKSALAYADSFTVIAVKDGIMTSAVISRKPDYTVTMKVLTVSKTDQPNGVKIQVPSRDYDAFARIAADFYRFWIPGTVEVDGVQPEQAVGEKLDNNLYFSKQHGISYVVMGNVAYRIANPEALFHNRGMNSISFVAYVPNGSCEFTPSREDLEYTDTTKATLYGVIDNFEKKVIAQAKADIATASDYFDAYSKWTYWTNKLGKGPFGELEFKGEKFTDTIPFNGHRYRPAESRYNMYPIKDWTVGNMTNTLIVTGMPAGTPGSHHKQRSKKYRDEMGIKASYILFTSDQTVESVWVDKNRVVSWDIIRAATKPPKKPKDPNAVFVGRIKGTFDYYDFFIDQNTGNYEERWQTEKPVPDSKSLFYISVQHNKKYDVVAAMKILKDNIKVIVLPANRINKFLRDNPHVKSWVEEYKKKVILDGIALLDADTRESLSIGSDTRAWLEKFDVTKIDDPEFARLKNLLTGDTAKRLSKYNTARNLAIAMQMRYDFKEHGIHRDNDSLLDKYPLVKRVRPYWGFNSTDRNEYTLYINAKYAAAQAASKKGN